MGSCVTREFLASAYKEPPIAPQKRCTLAVAPEQDSKESCTVASCGILSDTSTSPGAYHVTALATSSLAGLVQTIKDHVTKPTAMARGRVAHLIEWKGWSASQAGWEPSLVNEEKCYADLADELKEARFAAGVAEQFAITEATLSAWSSLDEEGLNDRGTAQDVIQLQDLGSLYLLQENFLLSPQATSRLHAAGSMQAFSCPSRESPIRNGCSVANSWKALEGSLEKPLPSRGGQESVPSPLWQQRSSPSLHFADSSSLSEDEVFYD